MSCGSRFEGRGGRRFEREELADQLEEEGLYRQARMVRRGECLDDQDTRKAKRALEDRGLMDRWDYRIDPCACKAAGED